MITQNNFDKPFVFTGKAKIWSFIMIAIGIAGVLYGFLSGSGERTFSNLLLMGYYFVSVCIFGVCFCAVQYISQAGWSASILRIPQVLVKLLPAASVILLVIISAGIFTTHSGKNEAGATTILPYLYKLWALKGVTTPGNVNYDPIIAGKSIYLNLPLFFVRMVAYLTVYSIMGRLLVKYSVNEDKIGGVFNYKKSFTLSAAFIAVFGFTVPLFVFDTIMSLEAHWFSTLFGWYNLLGFLATGFTVITLIIIYLKEAGYLPWVNENHLHTLGIQIFGFSIFWTYLWFEQFLLMYYSNLPEEAVYFYKRWEPEFNFWFWLNMTINFCGPFFVLMSRDSKRKVKVMKATCFLLIGGHWLDYWLMIMPGTTGPQSHWYTEIGVIEGSVFIGFTGLFIYMLLNSLSKFKALAPKNHPFLQESLSLHI
ncbi:quinol:cytochrome C oxidoreductase [Mucilaginibacter angelicae]|uniref:Quinol:cytochrome C oxidoreductase n=1 Tax=Mucilaginibacter angelicae TaxID=869718 RepID=A0ABV6L7A1_9SPHI